MPRADKDLYSSNDIRRMAMMKHPEDRTFYEKFVVFCWWTKQIVATIILIGIAIMWYCAEHPKAKPAQPKVSTARHHHHS